MKTTIEFKDGHVESYEDVMPNCYEGEVSLIYTDCSGLGDEVPIETVQRIVFEND